MIDFQGQRCLKFKFKIPEITDNEIGPTRAETIINSLKPGQKIYAKFISHHTDIPEATAAYTLELLAKQGLLFDLGRRSIKSKDGTSRIVHLYEKCTKK